VHRVPARRLPSRPRQHQNAELSGSLCTVPVCQALLTHSRRTQVLAAWLSQRVPSTTLLPFALLLSCVTQIVLGLVGQHLTGTSLGVFFMSMRVVMGIADGFIQVYSSPPSLPPRESRHAAQDRAAPPIPSTLPQVCGMGIILRIVPERLVPVAVGGVEGVSSFLQPVILPYWRCTSGHQPVNSPTCGITPNL
jgi:hypothetical protein